MDNELKMRIQSGASGADAVELLAMFVAERRRVCQAEEALDNALAVNLSLEARIRDLEAKLAESKAPDVASPR